MSFNQAKEYAARLEAHGHKDWRVPTRNELNMLFNHRAAIGGFDVTASHPGGWYFSAFECNDCSAWAERFTDGYQLNLGKDDHLSVRCVRSRSPKL